MAQIRPITSEAIEATIRRLLPSQSGFGEDMQAQNVIVPVIDLTPSAEGSILPSYLQSAISTDETVVNTAGATNTIISTPGFYNVRIRIAASAAGLGATIDITNGFSSTNIWGAGHTDTERFPGEFVVFCRAGYTVTATSSGGGFTLSTMTRQLADVYGNLSDPQGFTPQ